MQKMAMTICCICDKRATRIPDPELHEDLNDYCLEHYVEAGYAELWEIKYVRPQYGDSERIVIDVEPGTHPFKIPHLAGVSNWAYTWRKL